MDGVAGVRQLAGDHAVADDAEGVLVRAAIDGRTLRLLGRHVVRRADDHPGARESARRLERLRDSEVRQHHAPVVVEHDVRRLHVAVHDAALVRMSQGARRFPEHALDVVHRQRLLLIEHILERRALDVLHHEVVEAAFTLDAIDGNDVRMVELGRRLRLLLEALDDMLVHRDVGRQHFDRDFALERQVVREKHGAHSALPDHPLDPILAFDQPLQPRHQSVSRAATRPHRAPARDVRPAGVAELAAVGERRVAFEALHRGACRAGHGRRRGPRNGVAVAARRRARGAAWIDVDTGAPGSRGRTQFRGAVGGTILTHIW